MDFANERYVRVYTRDTPTWSLLSFAARSVFLLLLRKVDRAGTMDIPSWSSPPTALTKILDAPLEIVTEGLAELEAAGVICLARFADRQAIVVPNFRDAQETPASPAERKRRMRDRHRTYSDRTYSDHGHRTVAIGNADVHSRDDVPSRVPERSIDVGSIASLAPIDRVFGSPANNHGTLRDAESPLTKPNQTTLRSAPPISQELPAPKLATVLPDNPAKSPAIAATAAPVIRSEIASPVVAVAEVVATDRGDLHRSPAWIARWHNPPRYEEIPQHCYGHAWIADFRVQWCQLVGDLEKDLGRKLNPPLPWAGPEKIMGLEAALRDYGPEEVAEVMLAELSRWAHIDPVANREASQRARAFLSRMFIGDGFAAARSRWADLQARWDIAARNAAGVN